MKIKNDAMTDNHPITPPPELVTDWCGQLARENDYGPTCVYDIATKAARWGADQQLEQDAKWLDTNALFSRSLAITPSGDALRQAMRPKPPSLKEQALEALMKADGADHPVPVLVLSLDEAAVIRRALEQLDD